MPVRMRARVSLILACLLFLVLGNAYADIVPAWEAPDEPWHQVYIDVLAAESRLPTLEETYEAHHPPLYYLWPAIALRTLEIEKVEHAPYNPRFPFAPAAYLHTPDDPSAGALRLLRGFSLMLGVPFLCLVFATARRMECLVQLSSQGRDSDVSSNADAPGIQTASGSFGNPNAWLSTPILAALLAALWPQWLFIAAVISNDTLAALLGAGMLYALLRAFETPAWKPHMAAVFLLAAGILTKLNMLVLLPIVFATPFSSMASTKNCVLRLPQGSQYIRSSC